MVQELVPDSIEAAWRAAWSPPDRREIHEWAAEFVDLQGDYAHTGPFSVARSRQLILPFELLRHDAVRMLNILKAPQSGGSMIGDIFFQWVFANSPAAMQVTFQTDDDAEQHYLTRIEPTFKASKINAALFARLKKKRDLYQWPQMNAYFAGANFNSLQRKSLKYLWNDEVWDWESGRLGEAFARTEAYKRVCKILNVSQAADAESEWETVWNNARRNDWGFRCDGCGKLQPLAFFAEMRDNPNVRAGVVWNREARHSDGRWNIPRAAETTRIKCCFCGHEHVDELRTWERFNDTGDYVLLDPERSMVDCSVRWNGLVSGDWWRLVKKFLQACEVRDQGSTVPLENFYKKDLALFWDPSVAQQKAVIQTAGYLKENPQTKGYVPTKYTWEFTRAITADYQQGTGNDTRHLIVVVRVWAETGASRLIWEGRINTFEQLYQLATALHVKPACVGVDGSFEMMEVAAQCAKYGFTMLIGDDADYFLHKRKNGPPLRRPYSQLFKVDPGKGKKVQGRSFCLAMRWSNPAIKNVLWNLRHGLTRHKWELPDDLSPSYREGVDSEVKKRIFKKGSPVPVHAWVAIKANNHPWDCECEQVVIAVAAGCLTFDIEEEKPPAAPDGAAKLGEGKKEREATSAPHNQPEQLQLLPS